MNSGAPEGSAVPTPLVNKSQSNQYYISLAPFFLISPKKIYLHEVAKKELVSF